jgi:hypothetical protein
MISVELKRGLCKSKKMPAGAKYGFAPAGILKPTY